MNRKNRFLIPRLLVIAFALFAGPACFSGRAAAQKTEDLSTEAAQKAIIDKAATDKAAAEKAASEKEKAAWEARRKAEEAAERKMDEESHRVQSEMAKYDCETLNKRIESLQDVLHRRQEEAASLKKEVEDAGTQWAEITTKIGGIKREIDQAQERGDEKLRGRLQDAEKQLLNWRTSVVERRDKMKERIAEIEVTEYETIRRQTLEYTRQLADCKKKQAKAPPAPPPAPGPTTPPPGKEVAKDDCDGLKEKIRTLQDSLRKRQEEPASPKQDLETIRKQIDDLLARLADCPKQEPIDAQFDCLKSKFPEIQRSPDKKDAASDPKSKREFAWDNDKQAWIDKDTTESICPPSGIDSCLIGTWECTSFKEANKFITGGGTGFRVTFKSDGTETVDYSKMQPIRAGNDKMVYEGKATARISAKDGVAKIEKMIEAGVTFDAAFMLKRYGKEWNPKLPELGPGGLGTTKGKSNYKCTGDSLEYQSSTPRGAADCTVKLTKVKP
jgi:hypothetical protein